MTGYPTHSPISGNALPRNRHAIAGRATRYEVALYRDGLPRRILAYTERRTRAVLWAIMQDHADLMRAALAGGDPDECMTWNAKLLRLGWPEAAVGFTGRTERDAAAEIERHECPASPARFAP